jgi:hypothetical protein
LFSNAFLIRYCIINFAVPLATKSGSMIKPKDTLQNYNNIFYCLFI